MVDLRTITFDIPPQEVSPMMFAGAKTSALTGKSKRDYFKVYASGALSQ